MCCKVVESLKISSLCLKSRGPKSVSFLLLFQGSSTKSCVCFENKKLNYKGNHQQRVCDRTEFGFITLTGNMEGTLT